VRILLVEPWETGSHLAWAKGYQESSSHEVHMVGLPGELWRWRLRGGALPLAAKISHWIDTNGQPDLLVISGLVDVAELLGLARRNLSPDVGVVIYQHESQLVYPVADGQFDHGAALRNWVSWCAADLVLFNSYYHLRAVGEALPHFVTNLPDASHVPMLEQVVGRFEVFPVGVDLSYLPDEDPIPLIDVSDGAERSERDGGEGADQLLDSVRSAARDTGPPVILWPHRWEWDKDPQAFIKALDKVVEAGLEFRLVLAGQDPPSGSNQARAEREEVEQKFGSWILMSGELDREEYLEALTRCDLVVSCARHEFFGVAVVEAIAAGCIPLLPNALSYPELIRPPWHAEALYEPGTFGTRLVDAVARIDELKGTTVGLPQTMRRFDWQNLAPVYDKKFQAVVDRLATYHRVNLGSFAEPGTREALDLAG